MDAPAGPSWTRTLSDVVFAAALASAAVVVQLGGSEAAPANRSVDVLSVALTLFATVPLAVRRRWPLTVLVVSSGAIVLMALTKATVGLATIGPLVAFYSAIAYTDRRRGRAAVAVAVGVVVLAVVIRPVDLSSEGALVNLICLGFAGTLGFGVRERRERHDADVAAAEHRADLERRLAEQERRRADAIAVEERLRLTRELHDVIGHALSVMVVQAGVAERMLERRPDPARLLSEDRSTGRDSLADMRRLLERVAPGRPDPGAPAPPGAGRRGLGLPRRRGARRGLRRRGRDFRRLEPLPAGMQLPSYRIVQEALTNFAQALDRTSGHCYARPTRRRGRGRGRRRRAARDPGGPAAGTASPGCGNGSAATAAPSRPVRASEASASTPRCPSPGTMPARQPDGSAT